MNNRKLVLHVGFDKVGSSSIQTYLSHNDTPSPVANYRYGVLSKNGTININGLKNQAMKSPSGYVNSYPRLASDVNLESLKSNLDKLFESNITPILSSEGWAKSIRAFKSNDIFTKLNVKATIVIYVRPQVDWLNSAWWQWFNWESDYNSPKDFFNKRGHVSMNWNSIIEQWEDIPNVEKIHVRLQHDDVVSDFLSLFDIEACPEGLKSSRSNTSLAPELIKLLLTFPDLKITSSPKVNWKLREVFNFEGKSLWCINQGLAKDVIDYFEQSNKRLINKLDEKHKNIMKSDKRWWSAQAYQTKDYMDINNLKLSDSERGQIYEQSIDYILKHDLDFYTQKLANQSKDELLQSCNNDKKLNEILRHILSL